MNAFNKIVPQIVDSSLWNETSDTRIVWITMIAVKDENGYVRGDVRTLARKANVSVESCQLALELFQKPDPTSHTPTNEGRRIVPASGGWMVLNHEIYREIGMTEATKAYWRAKKRQQRSKGMSETVPDKSRPVNDLYVYNASASDPKGSPEGGLPVEDGKYTLPPARRPSEPAVPAIDPANNGVALAMFKVIFDAYELDPTIPDGLPLVQLTRNGINELLLQRHTLEQVQMVADWVKSGEAKCPPQGPVAFADGKRFPQWLKMEKQQYRDAQEDQKKARERQLRGGRR